VYSVNAVGYVNTPCVQGFTMVANPLQSTNNTIGSLIPNPPEFTTLYKWDIPTQNFDISTFFFGAWDKPGTVLEPGDGAFIQTETPFTITWVGDVLQGSLSTPVPALYSIRSSKVPQAGTLTALSFPTPNEFDTLYKWNTGTQNYDIFTYFFGAWSGPFDPGQTEPTVGVGQSFFYYGNGNLTWNRTFNVN
jgi:hypothetical protein